MTYRQYESSPAPDRVRRLTFVLFLPDGDCAAVPDPAGDLALPAGAVRDGEHWLLDTSLRVPLETAGFRRQRVHVFATDGDHVYAWLEGDRYRGRRPHARVELVTGPAAEIAGQLAAAGRPDQAEPVRDAAGSHDGQSEQDYYEDNLRLLEPAYLRGGTPQAESGFGGDPDRWRARREMIVDGIDRDGSFLDLGCANGLLLESVRDWAAERGYAIEPYGVDLAPGLVALARARLPHWADRIEVGNAIDYRPAGGRRFTFVHAMLDTVPAGRRAAGAARAGRAGGPGRAAAGQPLPGRRRHRPDRPRAPGGTRAPGGRVVARPGPAAHRHHRLARRRQPVAATASVRRLRRTRRSGGCGERGDGRELVLLAPRGSCRGAEHGNGGGQVAA